MKKKSINSFCLALISSFAFFIEYKKIFLVCNLLLIILLYFLYKKNNYSNNRKDIIVSLIFTFFYLTGQCARVYGDISKLFNIILIIRLFGLYIFFNYFISFIKKVIKYYMAAEDIKENKIVRVFNAHPFIVSLLVIIFSWSVYYVSFYPGILSKDPSYQIKQFFGERTKYLDYSIPVNPKVTITDHHPVLHTIILGYSIKLGRLILNDNFGIFIYTFIQGLILAISFAYTIKYLKKYNIKTIYLLFILMVYAFAPVFPFYALNCNKDVYYTIAIIFLTIMLCEFVVNYKDKKIPLKYLILTFFLLLFIALMRNNGVFIIILLFPFVIYYSPLNYKKIIALFVVISLSFISYKNILLPKVGIARTSVREALSIPFQQTARDLKYHEGKYNNEDKEVIKKILDYDLIKIKYKSNISDPVKNTFNKYYLKEDLKNYFKVWFRHLFISPITYINATVDNTYGYIYPLETNWYFYYKYVDLVNENNLLNYHYNSMSSLRNRLSNYGKIFPAIPFWGLIVNIGFNSWILIASFVYLLKSKKSKLLICLIPSYLSLLICFASPVNTYFRYVMPYMFLMPFILGILQKKEL